MKQNRITTTTTNNESREFRPALTPEAKEAQLISLAMDLAEQQLRDGTASSQVITHYLKLGSTREKLEQEKLKKDQELIDAKKKNLESTQFTEQLYNDAIAAMKSYSGKDDDVVIEDDINVY